MRPARSAVRSRRCHFRLRAVRFWFIVRGRRGQAAPFPPSKRTADCSRCSRTAALPARCESRFASTNVMRSATLCRSAFRRATASAAGLMSIAVTCACGTYLAAQTARMPLPVPTSAIVRVGAGLGLGRRISSSLPQPRAPSPRFFTRSSNATTNDSVSGRGISTSGFTSKSSE